MSKKQDYNFLDNVIIFENKKFLDSLTIAFKNGDVVGSFGSNLDYSCGDVYYTDVYFGEDIKDKEELKKINKANKHLGKYKTKNAAKRLSKNLLTRIQERVAEIENDCLEDVI
jgi:hypothetical protein